jgi:hypothetical protein
VAVYLSAHGLGHAVRAAAVVSALGRLFPLKLTVLAACDRRIWPPSLTSCTEEWIPEVCDAGVVQSDDVTVDLAATEVRLERWLEELDAIVAREGERLAGRFDLVLGDVPSPSFDAAEREGILSVAIANFSWDWIYSELGLRDAAEAAAQAYAKATLLVEATPFGPMPAFPTRTPVGLVAREPSTRRDETRRALGVADAQSLVLVAFQPASAPPLTLPSPRAGRVYAAPAGFPGCGSRPDFRPLPASGTFPDALAAADVVLGKPGYGLIGDVEAAGLRFLYVPRPGFPENAVLERHLSARPGTAALSPCEMANGGWEDRLVALEQLVRPEPADVGGAGRAAQAIARLLPVDSVPSPD